MLIDYQQFKAIALQLQESLLTIGVLNQVLSAAFKYSSEGEAQLGEKHDGAGYAVIHLCFKDSSSARLFYEVFAAYELSYKYKGSSVLCALDLAIDETHPLNHPGLLNQACQALAEKMGVAFLPPNSQVATLLASINPRAPTPELLVNASDSSLTCVIM